MGLFCNDKKQEKQELDNQKQQLDAREQQLREQEIQLSRDRKVFEDQQRNGKVNESFVSNEVSQDIEAELKMLRSQNEKLTKDINKRNRELVDTKKKVAGLEQKILETPDDRAVTTMDEQLGDGKRRAVIEAEEDSSINDVVLKRHSKAVKTTTMLKSALRECDLLKALDITHIEGNMVLSLQKILSGKNSPTHQANIYTTNVLNVYNCYNLLQCSNYIHLIC